MKYKLQRRFLLLLVLGFCFNQMIIFCSFPNTYEHWGWGGGYWAWKFVIRQGEANEDFCKMWKNQIFYWSLKPRFLWTFFHTWVIGTIPFRLQNMGEKTWLLWKLVTIATTRKLTIFQICSKFIKQGHEIFSNTNSGELFYCVSLPFGPYKWEIIFLILLLWQHAI